MQVTAKKLTKKPDVITSKDDEYGNLILIRNNGARLILSLKLRAETRSRRLGIVNLAQRTFQVKRTREKHLFRKMGGYGFNFNLLQQAKLFDKVRLKDDFCEWLIPKDFILTNGKFLNFINSGGFELQIFVSLSDIEQFKRPVRI